ncbi:MAG: phosphoglucomutase/phosphomannomutase family protein [Candidatus Dormibacteraeota bacterium]|nr:phosphoglucomutase/phosphomannomutase family protein [Candidatus Dormibacteraeota bacterium]
MLPAIRFGTDGWRGVVGDDFTYEALRYAAQGVAEHLSDGGGRPAVVGYDRRFASEMFAEEVARVFAGNGLRTLLLDRAVPTQVASWTVIERGAAGAVVITASHNPYQFNGLKFKPDNGSSAPAAVIADLERLIAAAVSRGPAAVRRAAAADLLTELYDPRPAYYRQLGRMVDLGRLRSAGLRLVHDSMHGSGAGYLGELLEGGATAVAELHADRNPWFGGVNPEPIAANLGDALTLMHRGGHDLCICTDGDADRVGLIDERGRYVHELHVYGLLMRYLVEIRAFRGPFVKSVNMTAMADRLGAEYGLPVYEVPVGFKSIAPKVIETDALLGGEESGGFAIRGHIPERDGLLAGLCLADMVATTGKPVSALIADLDAKAGPSAYARRDLHLERETYEQERARVLAAMAERRPAAIAGVAVERVRDDDGFKFFLADGSWVLLRASGTEPLIRVYSEATGDAEVAARLDAILDLAGLSAHAHA